MPIPMTRESHLLTFNIRYPFNRDLRINPRFRVDYRKNRDDNTDQIIYRPALRTSYQVRRKLRLEAEIGGEYSIVKLLTVRQKIVVISSVLAIAQISEPPDSSLPAIGKKTLPG